MSSAAEILSRASDIHPRTHLKVDSGVLATLKMLSHASIDIETADLKNLGVNKISTQIILDIFHKEDLFLMGHFGFLGLADTSSDRCCGQYR
ncbi:hypothetical protein CRT60_00575 [Azospirillum palustre]|uniref:Uncharacterized protein n=1 Tax=Azospirillum palustre TaxID=2044885 RepID=A0A2B8BPK6_9PROT|nr:hypothetical protein CRT60_00575 [Azospirillum palustre]